MLYNILYLLGEVFFTSPALIYTKKRNKSKVNPEYSGDSEVRIMQNANNLMTRVVIILFPNIKTLRSLRDIKNHIIDLSTHLVIFQIPLSWSFIKLKSASPVIRSSESNVNTNPFEISAVVESGE